MAFDGVHGLLNISAQAIMGRASEMMPPWVKVMGVIILSALSLKPLYGFVRSRLPGRTAFKDGEADRKAKFSGIPYHHRV